MRQKARKRLAVVLSAAAAPLTGWAEDSAGEAVRVNPLEVNSSQPRYLKGDLTVYTDIGSIEGNLEESGGFTKQGLFDSKKETGARSAEMSGDKAISESNPFWFSFKLQKGQPAKAPMACAITTYSLVSLVGEAENKALDPKDWKFYGSKDGKAWSLLDTQTEQEFTQRGEQKIYTFANSEAYAYYKLEVIQNWGQDGSGGNSRTGLAGIRVGLGADIDLVDLAGLYWNLGGEWGANATDDQKTETMRAFSTEYNRQMDLYNYNIGVSGRVHNQSNTTGVQCESALSDNGTSPWGTDRKWAQMSAPYAGMAFTVKGYMAKSQPDGNSGAALGNQVALEADDGSVWY
ncbi:MAG: hypothetical protein HFE86_07935 [Clostridiales bacterium]|nr:hypothetical protein [Clostridiales bacterium]